MAKRFTELFHSNHLIDCGSDHGEVKPVHRADIAVQHFADVQSDINISKGRVPFAFQVPNFQVGRRLNRGLESAAASSLLVPLVERDRRQHRIADKFEHVTSARPQRRGQCLKSIVEHLNNCRSGRHVADPRKTAQIGVPKHRAKAVDRSTLDRA